MAETGTSEFSTVIGPDASFKGDLTFEKGMRLHGKLSGTVTTAGRLHVAKEATCEAEVQAGSIIIEGEVRGNLTANDRVEMKPTARYEGDLTTSKLVVEEGAQFRGHVTVGPDAVKTKPQHAGAAKMGSGLPPAQVQGQPVK
jgi:cytoskeletal protein CcmA (bactofilin family)